MKKKGFTLVELLAVIAILAILVIMAVPNVINLFNDAKLRTFISQAQSLYKLVEEQVLAKQMKTTSANTYVFCSSDEESSLDLSGGDNLHYYITYVQGKMTSFFVENGTYLMYIDTTFGNGDIKISDLTKNTDGYYDYVYLLAPGKSINTCQAPSEDIKGEKVSIASNAVATPVDTTPVAKCETAVAFDTDSWETISCNVKNGTIAAYSVGDTKEIALDGYGTHTLRIANTSSPDECNTEGFSQSACGFVLEFADIIAKYNMNDTKTNIGGWPASAMYKLVNGTDDTTYSVYETDDETFTVKSIYMSLPEDLRNVIIDTTTISGHGSTTGETNFTSTDKLYLLSTAEVWAQGTENTIDNDTARDVTRQLDYYSNQNVTADSYSAAIKQYNGSAAIWWLRSASSYFDRYFYNVYSTGNWHYDSANNTYGVSAAFRIG